LYSFQGQALVTDFALPVLTPYAVAFLLGFALVAPVGALAVRLLAVEHARDLQVLALVAEEHPVVLGAKTNQGRLDTLKLMLPSPV
jgi:hypothetical protein